MVTRLATRVPSCIIEMTLPVNNEDINADPLPGAGRSPDPSDGLDFRTQAHRCWTIFSSTSRTSVNVLQPIPHLCGHGSARRCSPEPSQLADVHQNLQSRYPSALQQRERPPDSWAGYTGWTPVGIVAEMLAAGLNANLGGRDHVPIEVSARLSVDAPTGFRRRQRLVCHGTPQWPTLSRPDCPGCGAWL